MTFIRAHTATRTDHKKFLYEFTTDIDSFSIGIDTHASYLMTNVKSHFVGELKTLPNATVIGVNGKLHIKGIGKSSRKLTTMAGNNTFF